MTSPTLPESDASALQNLQNLPKAPKAGEPLVLSIPLMDCSAEEADIRHALSQVQGIRSLRFQLAQRTLTVDAPTAAFPLILEAVNRCGYPATPVKPGLHQAKEAAGPKTCAHAHEGCGHHGHVGEHGHANEALGEQIKAQAPAGNGLRYAVALVLAVGAEMLAFFAHETLAWKTTGIAMAGLAIGLAGFSTYAKGLLALRHGRMNINALMTVAVTGAFLIGQWAEAAMVMALYAIAEMIEARAVDRARHAIQGLLNLAPETAEVLQSNGQWAISAVDQVAVGDTVRVKPGSRIALDGVIISGSSTLDQSAVTGEGLPADKTAGDSVYAGTINLSSSLEINVSAASNNTLLSRIIQAVEAAQGSRAPTQQFVDRFARIYTPAVFALAVVVALALPWLTGMPWTDAVYKALVLLVIACPCALVISTPVSVVSGLAAAARQGILIKGGAYLENACQIRALALDKTGTITEGKPKLVAHETFVLPETLRRNPALSTQALATAFALAQQSDHPVSRAIADGLAATAEPLAPPHVAGFTAWPGLGAGAEVDGQFMVLGNHRLIRERGLGSPEIEKRMAGHEAQGRTVTLLANQREVLALFAVADTLKPGSRQALDELRQLGVVTVMLTGDNTTTARQIAQEAGIADARGDLLPEDKLRAVEDLQRSHGFAAMVGDGINDAPALARADIGIAMGGAGTDIAREAADVVIMGDDLRKIPQAIRLSRRTRAVLLQNMALALGIKAVFLMLAVFGSATMWMAVFADMGASLLVVGNGLRLLRNASPGKLQ